MTKVDIVSGFLGAGKTTFIKQLISQVFQGQKLVLIENEFGEIGIDGGFLKDSGIEITEMNSGCICCTLVGDFSAALKKVMTELAPDRIIIEPSGVGKLSDVIRAVKGVGQEAGIEIGSAITVVDCKKARVYMKNFGEFFTNQVEYAGTIVLSRTQLVEEARLDECVRLLREHNQEAAIITTPWDQLGSEVLANAIDHSNRAAELLNVDEVAEHCHEHDHAHGECCHEHEHDEHFHEHHHDHDEHCHDGEHHHGHDEHCHETVERCVCHEHPHDHDEHCHDGEHHHDHDEHCHEHSHDEHHSEHDGHCHEHHHDHHHADEVFTSWGRETGHKYSQEEITEILRTLSHSEEYGIILRAKGILPCPDDSWLQFDLVPEEYQVRSGAADYTGKICVIGTDLKEEKLKELFRL